MRLKRRKKALHIEGLEKYDFDELSKTVGSFRERKRYMAFAHIKEGKNFSVTAEMVRVSLRTLMNWVRKFRKEGIEGLRDVFGGGAHPHVHLDDYEDFRSSVLQLQESRKGGRIRAKDVAELIEKKYGITPSISSVYCTLKRAGLVWITGRSIHPKADMEAQEAFKKTLQIKCD